MISIYSFDFNLEVGKYFTFLLKSFFCDLWLKISFCSTPALAWSTVFISVHRLGFKQSYSLYKNYNCITSKFTSLADTRLLHCMYCHKLHCVKKNHQNREYRWELKTILERRSNRSIQLPQQNSVYIFLHITTLLSDYMSLEHPVIFTLYRQLLIQK